MNSWAYLNLHSKIIMTLNMVRGALEFFWWVCAAQVFKSRVYRTDFFLKKLGSWEQIFAQISVFGAEILPKLEKNEPRKCWSFWEMEKWRA